MKYFAFILAVTLIVTATLSRVGGAFSLHNLSHSPVVFFGLIFGCIIAIYMMGLKK